MVELILPFTTSEINWYIQDFSRVFEQLKTWGLNKLEDITKISKLYRTFA